MIQSRTRVGFIGLGDQGKPLAERIAAAGFPLTVWARRPEVMTSMDPHVIRASTPAELGRNSDVICICVFDYASVREVLFGPSGVAEGTAPGTRVLIHSTLSPSEIVAVAAEATERGLVTIDAPVSGGAELAKRGLMTVMLGGEKADCDAVSKVLESHASNIIHVGTVGMGQQVKLINNSVLAAHFAIASDAIGVANEFGIEGTDVLNVLAVSSGCSTAIQILQRLGSADAVAQGQAYPTLLKDVDLLARAVARPESTTLLPAAQEFVDSMTRLRQVDVEVG